MRYEFFARQLAENYLKEGFADGGNYPDMDLYIDQMVSVLNNELKIYADEKGEGPVTKAMVSNYTKHRMIPGPDGKKYNRDHLLFMTIVFYLKNCLSMDDIERLMAPVLANYSSEWDDKIDVLSMYTAFSKFLMNEEKGLPDRLSARIKSIKKLCSSLDAEDDTAELFTLITTLIIESNAERFIAEKLLEEYFTE